MITVLLDGRQEIQQHEMLDLPPETVDLSPDVPGPDELAALCAEARALAAAAVERVETDAAAELAATAERMRAESDALGAEVLRRVPAAVRAAAAQGRRVATLLRFQGPDKFREFCYLYLLKGPVAAGQRAEMKRAGVAPLLPGLTRELRAAGFCLHHAWQRSTNDNAITLTW